jgi:hypothetical protein
MTTENVWESEKGDVRLAKLDGLPFKDGAIVGIDLGTSNSAIAMWHLDKNTVSNSVFGRMMQLSG